MARPKAEHDVKRVQFDLPQKSLARLQRLKEITEAQSLTEVCRNALRLYEAIIDEVEAGNELLVRRGDQVSKYNVFSG